MRFDGLLKHLAIAFGLALGVYILAYWGIESRRYAKGPWEVRFEQGTNGHPVMVVNQPALKISEVKFGDITPATGNTYTVQIAGKSFSVVVGQDNVAAEWTNTGKTGVLDYTFARYLTEGEPAGMSFLEWVESPMYDPAGMKADFRTNMWGNVLTEAVLRRE